MRKGPGTFVGCIWSLRFYTSNKPLKASMRKYKVELFITEDDRHSPYLFQGLLHLENKGVIDLEIKSMPLLL